MSNSTSGSHSSPNSANAAEDSREIRPRGPLAAEIRPPGSKSITNRALVCAALAQGESTLLGALDSEDTRVMVDALRQLGLQLQVDVAADVIRITGGGGRFPRESADLFCANSGTTIRFLAAMLAGVPGEFRLDGVARMRERPIGDLVNGLAQLGADITYEQRAGFPPLVVKSTGLRGGTATIRGDISSQFLSGLLMAAPLARTDVEVLVDGPLVSQPYVHMTLGVMGAFGVEATPHDLSRFHIGAGQTYRAARYAIEPDASAASYFWGAAAVTQGRVKVLGLTREALQGDVAFCECLRQMGCRVDYDGDGITVTGGALRGIDVDMNAISDTVQTLAAVALFASGPTTVRGVAHIRHKETDRIGDLARELRKLGAGVDELADGLRIKPQPLQGCALDTYRDHRMAMSLALVGLRVPGMVIRDPGCTVKTYPRFFEDLDSLGTAR